MTDDLLVDDGWVPAACTLPTAEQPLRRQEFDDLFADDVLSVSQLSPLEVRFELRPDAEVAARAAGLAAKETGCCSFFTFGLRISDGTVLMTVSAEPTHGPVLAALGARAKAKLRTGS
ncbi:MAG TPA: hypothetical protein VNS81_01110 [Nocardioides sp.]|nr:hypothetical protein [Nocardioides sp.]